MVLKLCVVLDVVKVLLYLCVCLASMDESRDGYDDENGHKDTVKITVRWNQSGDP